MDKIINIISQLRSLHNIFMIFKFLSILFIIIFIFTILFSIKLLFIKDKLEMEGARASYFLKFLITITILFSLSLTISLHLNKKTINYLDNKLVPTLAKYESTKEYSRALDEELGNFRSNQKFDSEKLNSITKEVQNEETNWMNYEVSLIIPEHTVVNLYSENQIKNFKLHREGKEFE